MESIGIGDSLLNKKYHGSSNYLCSVSCISNTICKIRQQNQNLNIMKNYTIILLLALLVVAMLSSCQSYYAITKGNRYYHNPKSCPKW